MAAIHILQETIERELERRRPLLARAGVSSALEYYEGGGSLEQLPQIVILVDEFADLVSTLEREDRAAFLRLIQRYGQVTRAFGIYLILATQRPSVQVITGDIKNNLNARVAFKMQTADDSRTVLGGGGAETLRERGDMLFGYGGRLERLQGFLAVPEDARKAVARWAEEGGTA